MRELSEAPGKGVLHPCLISMTHHSFILTYFLQDTKHCPYSSKQSASHRAGVQGTVLPGSEDFLGGYTKAERLGESIQLVGEGLKEGKIRGPS